MPGNRGNNRAIGQTPPHAIVPNVENFDRICVRGGELASIRRESQGVPAGLELILRIRCASDAVDFAERGKIEESGLVIPFFHDEDGFVG